ncbi:chymotrypsinogen 2-like [Anoplophora glabripennis]|uniref:chymotrypsinogen 2-like n=1 Tax=Anoplophora glabripennis TaxID=217634 RepID=UPI00087452DB|nr:chymotrypsinogen 2-like [Anoplophora glabripennis]
MENRIINGSVAKLGQFPWMARIGTKYKDGSTYFICGASLITRTFLVSAAHCGEWVNIARLGQTYETNGTECDQNGACAPPYQDIKIKSYLFEDFCKRSFQNDIVLYQLDKPAELNDFVQPICLSRISIPLSSLVGENIITSGWGRQIRTDPTSNPQKLMYIAVPVQDMRKCIPLYYHFDRNTQFCLTRPNDKSVCFGDSGSGAVKFMKIDGERRAHLIGITSYVKKDCSLYPVFAFVENHLDRILIQINKHLHKNIKACRLTVIDSEDISHEIEQPSLCLTPENQLIEELSDIEETLEDQEKPSLIKDRTVKIKLKSCQKDQDSPS